MREIFLGLTVFFAACVAPTEEPASHEDPSGVTMTLSSEQRAACEASGGIVERAGLLGAERCTRTFSDAGSACKSSDDCEGQCRAEPGTEPEGFLQLAKGVCQANDNPFGCFANVENGTLGPMLCVD